MNQSKHELQGRCDSSNSVSNSSMISGRSGKYLNNLSVRSQDNSAERKNEEDIPIRIENQNALSIPSQSLI